MSLYCEPQDLYAYGMPSGSIANPGRLVQDIAGSTPTTLLTLDGHALADNAVVQFRAEAGGALPTGLSAGVSYYARVVNSSTFAVAASTTGGAVTFTPPVTNVIVVVEPPVTSWIEWASNLVDNFLPAHVVPLQLDGDGKYPPLVVAVTADLAAARGMQWAGSTSVNMQDKIAAAQKLLDRWGRGVPLRGQGASAQGCANLAVFGHGSDARGWAPSGGGIP